MVGKHATNRWRSMPKPARVSVAAAGLATGLLVAALAGNNYRSGTGLQPTDKSSTSDVSAEVVPVPAAWFLIANLSKEVPRHSAPGAEPDGAVPATWHGRPNALPVIDQDPGWLQVRLPERPNGSTAWIRREDAELTTTPYRIEIDIATTRLRLFDSGGLVFDAPAGIGVDEAPTVVGKFYVAFLQEAPDGRDWGDFVMVTSQHSETISDWEQSGDAVAAIHGPLGSAEKIGTTGAKVSQGCIRLHHEHLVALRPVPAGSPVDVVDSSATGA